MISFSNSPILEKLINEFHFDQELDNLRMGDIELMIFYRNGSAALPHTTNSEHFSIND